MVGVEDGGWVRGSSSSGISGEYGEIERGSASRSTFHGFFRPLFQILTSEFLLY